MSQRGAGRSESVWGRADNLHTTGCEGGRCLWGPEHEAEWLGLEIHTMRVMVTIPRFDLSTNSHIKPVKLPWRGSGRICASKSALWLLCGE